MAGGTPEGLEILREHLPWVGDVRLSVISDEVLMRKWLYVGSLPHQDDNIASGPQALRADILVPKGMASHPMNYNAPLTAPQFNMMLEKAVKIFEAETNHLERDDLKVKCKPKGETWMQYRDIIQHWDTSMASVAKKDLSDSDFILLEEAVLKSKSMDQEIPAMLGRHPTLFHIGLLPTCSTNDVLVDEAVKAVHQAHVEAARGKFKVLEAELEADWATISAMQQGS